MPRLWSASLAAGCMVLIMLAGVKTAFASPQLTPYCSNAEFFYTGYEDSAEQQDKLCRSVMARSVKRNGDSLKLQLANGTSKTYRNNRKACDNEDQDHCVFYWLVGYHTSARLFILLIVDGDGFSYMFVSQNDGTEIKLEDMPHFAPDGSSFIVLGSIIGNNGGSFAIGSVGGAPSLSSWKDFSSDGSDSWEFQRWIDNDHIAVKQTEIKGVSVRKL